MEEQFHRSEKVCLWFDLEDGQRMGTPAKVMDITDKGMTLQYMVLGEIRIMFLSEGKCRTNVSKLV